MSMKMLAGAAGAMLLASTLALAQAPSGETGAAAPMRPLTACRAEVEANCKTVGQGKGQRLHCLRANQDKASAECRAALQKLDQQQAARRDTNVACREDAKALCGTVEKRYAPRVACLKQNEAKLSANCKAALAIAPAPPANTKQ